MKKEELKQLSDKILDIDINLNNERYAMCTDDELYNLEFFFNTTYEINSIM